MDSFRAFRIHNDAGSIHSGITTLSLNDLSPGDVVIRVYYSSANYKDALAGTGKGKILRRFPLNGGVDAAGIVLSSTHPAIHAGDSVIVTGYGLSQDHDGGYAEVLRVPGEWVVPLPAGLSLQESMLLGTAGFTAALALYRMEQNGQRPQSGPIVVTGATGGVGSIAIDILHSRGYEVVAITGKESEHNYLRTLGASTILPRHQSGEHAPPLEKTAWGGAIDNAGGATLAWLTRTVRPWGTVASIGLAGGSDLHTSIMPFILRGVSILGISSTNCPMETRREIWNRLATDWRPPHLDVIANPMVSMEQLPEVFGKMLAGESRGRTVVGIE